MKHRGDWMQTFGGRPFWPLDPKPVDVCIEDIARASALTNRFKGHSLRAVNLAQHQLMVSYVVRDLGGDERTQLGGLLHDAHEVLDGIGDVARPVKESMPLLVRQWYNEHVRRVELAIFECFGIADLLNDTQMALIKRADDILLATEKRDHMAPSELPWGPLPEPLSEPLVLLNADEAEMWYLLRFGNLIAEIGQ